MFRLKIEQFILNFIKSLNKRIKFLEGRNLVGLTNTDEDPRFFMKKLKI